MSKIKDKRKQKSNDWIGSGMTASMCALTRKRLKRSGTKKYRKVLRKEMDESD
jgi:hypothetical protein